VNFSQRFAAATEGDPWQAYQALRQLNPAPFAAYLSSPYCQVMCSSPERFLQVRGGLVETKPIKGTCPRGRNPVEDFMLADMLRASVKDRAENLMIVDLLRNDLGRVCALGTIEVPHLFALESFARVHHLVSTVRGRLAAGRTPLDLLRACFPGGSVTGAPKVRAMEVIEELEPHRRGVYCGSIGYLGFDGAMDTNIAIRTLVHSHGLTRLWAGGGIVADSDPDSEYRETYHKAAPLLELLDRMPLADVGS
jgi:para-aminobenzoate synthetase component 1